MCADGCRCRGGSVHQASLNMTQGSTKCMMPHTAASYSSGMSCHLPLVVCSYGDMDSTRAFLCFGMVPEALLATATTLSHGPQPPPYFMGHRHHHLISRAAEAVPHRSGTMFGPTYLPYGSVAQCYVNEDSPIYHIHILISTCHAQGGGAG